MNPFFKKLATDYINNFGQKGILDTFLTRQTVYDACPKVPSFADVVEDIVNKEYQGLLQISGPNATKEEVQNHVKVYLNPTVMHHVHFAPIDEKVDNFVKEKCTQELLDVGNNPTQVQKALALVPAGVKYLRALNFTSFNDFFEEVNKTCDSTLNNNDKLAKEQGTLNTEIEDFSLSDFEEYLFMDFLSWGDMFEDNIFHFWHYDEDFRNEVMYTKMMPNVNSWYKALQIGYSQASAKDSRLEIDDYLQSFDEDFLISFMDKAITNSYNKILAKLNDLFEEYIKNVDKKFIEELKDDFILEKLHEFKVKEFENEGKYPKFEIINVEPTYKLSEFMGKNKVLEDFKKACFEDWSLKEAQENVQEPDLDFLTSKDWELIFGEMLKVSVKFQSSTVELAKQVQAEGVFSDSFDYNRFVLNAKVALGDYANIYELKELVSPNTVYYRHALDDLIANSPKLYEDFLKYVLAHKSYFTNDFDMEAYDFVYDDVKTLIIKYGKEAQKEYQTCEIAFYTAFMHDIDFVVEHLVEKIKNGAISNSIFAKFDLAKMEATSSATNVAYKALSFDYNYSFLPTEITEETVSKEFEKKRTIMNNTITEQYLYENLVRKGKLVDFAYACLE